MIEEKKVNKDFLVELESLLVSKEIEENFQQVFVNLQNLTQLKI